MKRRCFFFWFARYWRLKVFCFFCQTDLISDVFRESGPKPPAAFLLSTASLPPKSNSTTGSLEFVCKSEREKTAKKKKLFESEPFRLPVLSNIVPKIKQHSHPLDSDPALSSLQTQVHTVGRIRMAKVIRVTGRTPSHSIAAENLPAYLGCRNVVVGWGNCKLQE